MKSKMQQIIIVLLAHFLMYPVYIDGVSKALQQVVIFGSITIFVLVKFNNFQPIYKSMGIYKRAAIISITFLILILSASFFIPLMYNTNDFSFFSNIAGTSLYLVFYIILVALINMIYTTDNTRIKLMEIIAKVQKNYVIVTILFLLFPTLKMLWMNIITMTPRGLELIQNPAYISRVSWDGYAGFTSTVYSTISVIISIYLIVEFYKKNKVINKRYFSFLVFSLIGNAFYGRSGLLISVIMVIIGVMYLVIFYKQYKILFSIIGLFLFLFMSITILANFNSTIASWYNWAMEPVISLFETGEIQTRSTNILWDMWFVPESKTFFLGDGYYSSPTHYGYYMETDVGFLRPILFFGWFFTILYYLIPFVLGLCLARDNRESKLLVSMIFISLMIFEIKGEVVFKFLPIIVMLFVASYIKKPRNVILETRIE